MPRLSAISYVVAVALLFAKLLVVITLQGQRRKASGRFRYPEDARAWSGEVAAPEADDVERLQAALRNDQETVPYFLALGAAYVALGASPLAAPLYFGAFVLSRIGHGLLMLRPRQPLRTQVFGLGILTLLALTIHVLVAALSATPAP